MLSIVESGINHFKYVGFGTGIVALEALEIFVGLKLLSLSAQDVAECYERACQPVLVARFGVDDVVHHCPCLTELATLHETFSEIYGALHAIHTLRLFGKSAPYLVGLGVMSCAVKGKCAVKLHFIHGTSAGGRGAQQLVGGKKCLIPLFKLRCRAHHPESRFLQCTCSGCSGLKVGKGGVCKLGFAKC